jgi:hypothetical protein
MSEGRVDITRALLDATAFLRDASEMSYRTQRDITAVRQQLEAYIETPERLFDSGEAAVLLRLDEHLAHAISGWEPNLGREVFFGSVGAAQELLRYLHTTADLSSRTEILTPGPLIYTPFCEAASTLLQRLSADPREWHALGPRRFEELLAEIWSGLGWETLLTPPSGDGGLDIRAIRNDKGICLCYLIEAKAYDPARPVGIELVRTLYGVVERERATHGILATTSHFTIGAIQEARALRYRVSLADFHKVLDWTQEYRRRARR